MSFIWTKKIHPSTTISRCIPGHCGLRPVPGSHCWQKPQYCLQLLLRSAQFQPLYEAAEKVWFRKIPLRKRLIPRVWIPLFGGSVTKEDIYEYLYFLNQTCGNKKSSTARRLASLHGFYDFMVNHASRLENDPTAVVSPPKLDKVLPKYLTADQARNLLDVTRTMSDFLSGTTV